MKTTVIVDSGTGNLRSVLKALEAVAPENTVRTVSADPQVIRAADRLVLPGVSTFKACADGIAPVRAALLERARAGVPLLGICVGMQLLAEEGEEYGTHAGLGLIAGRVRRLPDAGQRLPHMGWNTLELTAGTPPFDVFAPGDRVYFVHSYHFEPADAGVIAARSTCGGAVRRRGVAKQSVRGAVPSGEERPGRIVVSECFLSLGSLR